MLDFFDVGVYFLPVESDRIVPQAIHLGTLELRPALG